MLSLLKNHQVKGFIMNEKMFNEHFLERFEKIKNVDDAINFSNNIDEDCRFGLSLNNVVCHVKLCDKCHHLICTMIEHVYCSREDGDVESFECLCDNPFSSMDDVFNPICELYGRYGTITKFDDMKYVLHIITSVGSNLYIIPFGSELRKIYLL